MNCVHFTIIILSDMIIAMIKLTIEELVEIIETKML